MGNRGSIARFVSVCIICAATLFYGFYSLILEIPYVITAQTPKAEETSSSDTPSAEKTEGKTEEKKETQSEAQQTGSEQTQSSVTAASDGVVKGKVIKKYISPYSAPLSYDGAYMKNNTDLAVDIKSFIDAPLSFKISKNDQPQVLIMHTHTTESYMKTDSDVYTDAHNARTLEENMNMVRIGDIVAEKLNEAGIKTLHDKTRHDYPEYTGSYSRAAKTICSYTEKYKSIKIVLDLHRDAVSSGESDRVKLVTEIKGKPAAQVMLVMGSQSGSVTNFPNWQENLKLALKLQQTFEKMYPTLARPLSLMSKNYNESLTNGSLLIEFGTDVNSIDEATYSAEMVGNAIADLLNRLT